MLDKPTPASINGMLAAARDFVKPHAEQAILAAETYMREAEIALAAARAAFDEAKRASGMDLAALRNDWQRSPFEPPPVYPVGAPIDDYLVRGALKMCPPLRGLECDMRLVALGTVASLASKAAEHLRAAHFKLYFAQSALRHEPRPHSAAGFPGLTDGDIQKAMEEEGIKTTQETIEWYRSNVLKTVWDSAVKDKKDRLNICVAAWWRTWARLFLRVYTSCDV